jgi:type I restriction enzyme M protein
MYNITVNNVHEKPKPSDIETPIWVSRFIHDLVVKHMGEPNVILDPCAGNGRLTRFYKNSQVIEYEIKRGSDFLMEEAVIDCDLVLCNPPFNLGVGRELGSFRFLKHIFEICGYDVPVFLITPMGFRLNQRKKSERWKRLIQHEISSIISLPLDCFKDTLFHCEILVFNMPQLKPHYYCYPHKLMEEHRIVKGLSLPKPISGEDLKTWRVKHGLSLNEVADLFEVSKATVCRYQAMERLPNLVSMAIQNWK